MSAEQGLDELGRDAKIGLLELGDRPSKIDQLLRRCIVQNTQNADYL